jgi:hypothetical protein
MVALRRLALLTAVCGLAAVLAGPAAAVPRPAGSYPETKSSTHFTVHYTGEFGNLERITHQEAADLAALLEQAYTKLVTDWGYPAPLDDGDGHLDVWVQTLGGYLGIVFPDGVGNTSTAWMTLDLGSITSTPVVTHELMHMIQYGQWVPADSWLLEGTAEWAGFAANNYVPFGAVSLLLTLGAPDMSLDCVGDPCGNDLYETGGYSRWTFFEYLSDRFGNAFMKDVLARGAALANPALTGAQLLDSALVLRGTTLSDVFGDYTVVQVAGKFDVKELIDLPPAAHSTTLTGVKSSALPVQRIGVNRLAAKYLRYKRGAGVPGECQPASLALTVAIPAGLPSKPVFYSKSLGTVAQALSISGSTASITVPWDTCDGSPDGYLSLPNASLASDAQVFTVSGTVTVDSTGFAAPVGPPAPIYTGPIVSGGTADLAPSIFVYGAQVLKVSATTRLVRLIVFSSGSGSLQASVGGKSLGKFALRAGNNDVRFRLPLSAVKALRSTSAARASSSILTLTSLSTAGAKGKTVTRRLAVTRAKR